MPSYSNSFTTQSGIDAQVNFLHELTRKTFDAMRKLGTLNAHFSQQLMQTSGEAVRQSVHCQYPFQQAAVAAGAAQQALQHLQHYQQQLAGMLAGAQLDLTGVADGFLPESARYAAAAMLQDITLAEPAGSDPFGAASHASATSRDAFGSAARGDGGSIH